MAGNFYTQEELEAANHANLASTLNSMGYELKREGTYYRSKLHSSLVINDEGKWAWNSQDIKGKKPVELVKQLLTHDHGYAEKDAYIAAIKKLAQTERLNLKPSAEKSPAHEKPKGPLVLPEKNSNFNRALAYLCNTRGLDYGLVKGLISQQKIYETKGYHNVCFVAYDEKNNPRHAFLRGTATKAEKQFKMDAPNSDKAYAFSIMGRAESKKVFVFESAIDAISHATLYKMQGADFQDGHRISLNGVSFAGLKKFLEANPQVTQVVACLDNDKTGHTRTKALLSEFRAQGYKTFFQLPENAKDFNEALVRIKTQISERTDEQEPSQ